MGSRAAMIPYVIQEGSCSLFVSVLGTGPYLDESVPAGKNHLFYLEREDRRDGSPEFLLLFLREVEGPDMNSCHGTSRPRKFKLVLCCSYLDIFFMFRKPKRANGSTFRNLTIYTRSSFATACILPWSVSSARLWRLPRTRLCGTFGCRDTSTARQTAVARFPNLWVGNRCFQGATGPFSPSKSSFRWVKSSSRQSGQAPRMRRLRRLRRRVSWLSQL